MVWKWKHRYQKPLLPKIMGLTAVIALASAGLGSCSSTDKSSTTTTTSSSTTTLVPSIAVWPPAGSSTQYTSPEAAARAFATGYVGFVAPVVGPFRQGDSRSGEVDVRPSASGPVTIVLVRQLSSDGSWSVIGATTANIRVDKPAALAELTSPVTLEGTSTAFEGTVQTEIREDGTTQPLGKGYVTGGSNGQMGPFSGTLAFSHPTSSAGALILYTVSAQDGHVSEAGVLRVRFTQQ